MALTLMWAPFLLHRDVTYGTIISTPIDEEMKGAGTMKIYHIILRHSTVVDTLSVSASNAKRAKRYALKRTFLDPKYASIYKMQRVF